MTLSFRGGNTNGFVISWTKCTITWFHLEKKSTFRDTKVILHMESSVLNLAHHTNLLF